VDQRAGSGRCEVDSKTVLVPGIEPKAMPEHVTFMAA
jgi:hypothetical protein